MIAALPGEARAFARLRAGGRAPLAGGGHLALSGLGPKRAAAAARALVAEGVDGLVSWGSATALVPWLAAGDLLLPRTLVTAVGASLAVDADWGERLTGAIADRARIRNGPLAEVGDVLVDAVAKQALHERSGALAADMESAAIAAVAAEFELPFIAVRAIADDSTMTVSPAARAAVDDDGALRPLRLLRGLARPPAGVAAELRALGQLATAFRAAQRTLDAAAAGLLEARAGASA